MSTESPIKAAAVVYRFGEHDRRALIDFARELVDGGCRLGGMVQEAYFDDDGRRTHIDSVDLATGDHVMINQPSRNWDCKECTLDTAALADAGAPLRRALTDRPDPVIAEGQPTLVLVPEPALPCWRELTAGGIEELPCRADALRRWWRERSGESS